VTVCDRCNPAWLAEVEKAIGGHTYAQYDIACLAQCYGIRYPDGTYQAIRIDRRWGDLLKPDDIKQLLLASPRRAKAINEAVIFDTPEFSYDRVKQKVLTHAS
jgi:hypothetical protein